MIKQQQTQRHQQKLSPLQIQQIKLLELNSLEFENRIDQELEENPVLEEVSEIPPNADTDNISDKYDNQQEQTDSRDDFESDEHSDDDMSDYNLHQNRSSENRREIPYSGSQSFREYLISQLRMKQLTKERIKIGEYIIGNIDEDGYIRRSPEAISDDLAFQYGQMVSTDEIREIMRVIQELDPSGIGAIDLQECLLIQLQNKKRTPAREIAINIIEFQFDAFSKKQYEKIGKGLTISENELRSAIKEIMLLNPKPGSSLENGTEAKMSQITPDFIVETINGELIFTLPNENMPALQINRKYGEIMKDYAKSKGKNDVEKKEAITFVRQKIDAGKWFIDAIKQRNTTLRKTMLAIIDIQHDFFLTGDETDLKPMILKDVSERCGYDISTVSRVSNSKYVQTNWGIYPLRFFFSEAATNNEGEEVSTREIKLALKTCIDAEDKTHPMTDDALTEEMKKIGYDIARRTISKYREQLNIPTARMRKDIS